MRVPHISPDNVIGLADKIFGLQKEVIGQLLDRETLQKSGQLQQEKGTAKLEALQAEIKAETQKAKVKTLDKAQQKAADAS